jgi:hypothetical protein
MDDVSEVVINADVVNKDDVEPIYVRDSKNKKSASKKKDKETEKAAS